MKLNLKKKKLKNLSLDHKVVMLEQTKFIGGGKKDLGNKGTQETWLSDVDTQTM
ncbi:MULTISPECIES: hypothetical protein [unclassified Pseudoalteromonas]|uniref:hypothetical protein n=1 Tax=unclassified Pseudoalteromonas TaxID=194690 RepID=UPI000A3F3A1D|nr:MULTISPECIES: hypothetical protein [unclassified Pseudoalteromonas]